MPIEDGPSAAPTQGASGVDLKTRAELHLNFEGLSRLTPAGTADAVITTRGLKLQNTSQGYSLPINAGDFVTPELFVVDLENDFLGSDATAVVGWAPGGGLGDVAAVTAQDFAGILWTGTTWQAITVDSAGVAETTDIASGSFGRYAVEYTGTAWEFYKGGTLIATHSTNIPDVANMWAPFTVAMTRLANSPYITIGKYYARFRYDA